ncbi:hypothetical protein OH77DRAFT_1429527 [Trametes cingulata]|nr:hypothetical protein OH77DRAFT_1429527 [Trametes cingulata]
MPVRCFQCKTKLGGRGSGQAHAKATGHVWQPGYYCKHCKATFRKDKVCKAHQRGCSGARPVLPTAALPVAALTNAVSTESGTTASGIPSEARDEDEVQAVDGGPPISRIVSCDVCREQFRDADALALHCQEHATAAYSTPTGDSDGSSRSREATREPLSPSPAPLLEVKAECDVCQIEFTSSASLQEHAASVDPCKRCSMCIPRAKTSLQEHYRESFMHPTCERCGAAFETYVECYEHQQQGCLGRQVPLDLVLVEYELRLMASGMGAQDADDASLPTEPGVQADVASAAASADTHENVSSSCFSPATISPGERALGDDPGATSSRRQPPGDQLSVHSEPAQDAPELATPPVPVVQNALRHTADPERSPLDLDNTSDVDHRSSLIAIAALDLIAQRYGTFAARRVARVMQELGAAPAEGESDREHENSKMEVKPHPAQDLTLTLETPTTLRMGISTPTERSYLRRERSPSVDVSPLLVEVAGRRPGSPSECSSSRSRLREPVRQSTSTTARSVQTSPQGIAGVHTPPRPKAPSWHCRACMRDSCQDPTAAICGHIFCRQCFIQELATRGACPVCQKVFLLRLDVGADT